MTRVQPLLRAVGSNVAKLIVTVAAIAAIIARYLWPQLQLDSITLAFVVIAVVPWLASWVASVELPGGFKVGLHPPQAAKDNNQASPATPHSEDELLNTSNQQVAQHGTYTIKVDRMRGTAISDNARV